MSVVLTLWLAIARPSDIAHMNDIAVERELYMDTDSEDSIDDESGSLPPHQEPFSGSEDSVDEEDVEPEMALGRLETTNVGAALSFNVPPPVLVIQILHSVPHVLSPVSIGIIFMNIN
jgi:hypothetical protein